jgi:hypothetical protein
MPEPVAAPEVVASPAQRYTLDGDDAVEARIARDQTLIADAVTDAVDRSHFVALVMMGGYGRAEGGYVMTADGPAPYNDYDYFVVVRHAARGVRAKIQARLQQVAHDMEHRVGVEVDFALLREERLARAEHSLMNTEMRWGHRVVAGQADVLLAMPPMSFDTLPPGEITRLMLNRGTLLLMNQQRLKQGGLDAAAREVFFKYLFKAVLACGDARLALARRYHPSYPVKLQRLEAAAGGIQAAGLQDFDQFLALYRLAYRHKFHPDYAEFANEAQGDWQARVLRIWLTTLRAFEIHRLGSAFANWTAYCRCDVGKGQGGGVMRNLAVNARDFGPAELLRRPGRSVRYPRERLIAALPMLLSEFGSLLDPCTASALAVPPKTRWTSAVETYLGLWRKYA